MQLACACAGEVPLTPHEMEEERGRRRAAKAELHLEEGELDGVLGDTGWLLETDEDMAKGLAGNGCMSGWIGYTGTVCKE